MLSKIFQRNKGRKPEGNNFCYYPFMQILVTSDGKYRPCSKHQDYITHEGKVLHAATAGFQEAWNSDYMKKMRKDFLDNKQFAGCSECWRQQNMGLKSMRYDSYQYNVPETQVQNPLAPLRVEINASNICNLRCRICYPNASSKWIKEGKELYGQYETIYKNLEGSKGEEVREWAPFLEEICFFGGEPLLSEDNLDLLDYLIENGYASKIALLFNTNGTIFNENIAAKLCAFKRVRMYFSIDDIGERFEYQRSGAVWKEVEANIQQAYNLSRSSSGRNIDFKICCTVSSMNLYYFPEYYAYFGQHFPGLPIFWNFIFDPWRLSMQILPVEVKAVIKERLKLVQTTFETSEGGTKTMQELITYLDFQESRPFEEFFRWIHRHDVYRKESFAKVFPEFWKLISPWKPADITEGEYDAVDQRIHQLLKDASAYPALHQIQQYREMKMPFAEFDAGLEKNEWISLMLQAMNDVAAAKGIIGFEEKSAELLKVLQDEQILKDFTADFMLNGPFKFQEAINDLEKSEVAGRMKRKYFRSDLMN